MNTRKINRSWVDEFIDLGEDTESPVLYYKWVGLVFVACALRRNVWLRRPRYIDYPNLYVILVSPPGVTRKSTPCDFGYESVVSHVPAINKFTGRITTEALCKKLSKMDVNYDSNILEANASLFLYASELSSLFKRLPRGSYPVIDFLTAIYSSGNYTYETNSNGEQKLSDICINMLAATTVAGINDLIGVYGVEGGFASRTVFVYQDVRMPKPWPDDDFNDMTKIGNLIADLSRISTLKGEMKIPAISKRWFDAWYIPQALENPPSELIHYWTRRHDLLLKLAMLYSVSERDDLTILVPDFEKAKSTLEEVERFMPYAFQGIEKTKESCIREIILSYVKMHSDTGITQTEVLRKFQHRVKGSKELRDIMGSLIDMGSVSVVHSLRGKGVRYVVNKGC